MGLFDDVLSADQTLIKNDAALDYEFLPRILKFRENEQKYLATALKPLFSERSGRNLFIFGAPGIGKTAAVRHVLNELEEHSDDIVPIYVNCWRQNTSYKVFVEICEELGYHFTQNKKTTELQKIALQLLNKKSAVLVFDEIDKAEDKDFLYVLIEGVYRKSIFLITNYRSWLVELDERIRSRLMAELQEFRPYTESETKGIIQRYTTLVNFAKLGYTGYGVYSRFQNVNDKRKQEIIRYLSKIPELYWIALIGGKFDISFGVMAKNIVQFNKIYYKILNNYGLNLVDNTIAIRTELRQHKRNYLSKKKEENFLRLRL